MAQPVALSAGQTGDAGTNLGSGRVATLAGWMVAAVALLQASAGLALAALNNLSLERLFSDYFVPQCVASLAFAVTGIVIITRRPGNLIGWHLCALSFGAGFNLWLFQYARYATVVNPDMPAGNVAVWLSLWIWVPLTAMPILLLPLLFPNGRMPARYWLVAAGVIFTGAVLLSLSIAIDPASTSPLAERGNPLFTSTSGPLVDVVTTLAIILVLGGLACAIAAPVVRYRRAGSDERLQLKWFAFATVLVVAAMVTPPVLDPSGFTEDTVLSAVLLSIALPMLPVSVAIAVLRYRLYDIDLLINRALVYAGLTACVIGLYVFVVGYLSMLFRSGTNWLITLVATGLVAVLFQPLRSWLQLGVNRLLYGERDEPYAVLTRLGQQLEHTVTPDETLARIVQTVATALKSPYAVIWILDDSTLRPGAVYGTGPAPAAIDDAAALRRLREEPSAVSLTAFDAASPFAAVLQDAGVEVVLPLSHRGELVGALCVASRRRHETFSPADHRLLRDLARQAGATVQSVQLTMALRASLDELQRSRERLVMAQEEERRRIQRDLHDDLGPTLAGMRPRIEGALDLARDLDPQLVQDLERLDELVGQASAAIRQLVYDLRPPVLDQLGLETALRQYTARFSREHGIAVDFAASGDLNLPAATEVALFRIVQEALANVQKHSCARSARVSIHRGARGILLEVHDDGVGLSPEREAGTGLASMRERAELSGGTLEVANGPDGGVLVTAMIPLRGGTNDTA